MFLQTTYETKLRDNKTIRTQRQQTADPTQRRPIHKKWVIGSNHLGNNKNYQRDFQFFSIDDIPRGRKMAHDEACDFVDRDLLGLKKSDWNGSSKIPKYPHLEETFERKLTKIKIGLLDHPVLKEKPNKIYMGTETREKYTDWNVSTAQDIIERKKQLEYETNHAMRMTAKKFNALTEYVKPKEFTSNYNENLRILKTGEHNLRSTIREKYKYDNPNASLQRVDGAVYRLTHEYKIKHANPQSETEAANLTFKPDLSRTLKQPKEFNTHSKTLQIFVESKESKEGLEGQVTKTEAIFKTVPQTYHISNKKVKTVDEMWQITPEEEDRIENIQKTLRSKHEEHSPSHREQ